MAGTVVTPADYRDQERTSNVTLWPDRVSPSGVGAACRSGPVGTDGIDVRGDAAQGPVSALRLMAVHAHPDDESSKGAATMARYVAEGVDVLVVTCTGGERGNVLNPRAGTGRTSTRTSPRSAAARWSGPAQILGVQQQLARLRRLRACRRATRRRRCRRAASRWCRSRRPPRRSCEIRREFRPHVDHDLRRERRLPASRPHPDATRSRWRAFEAAADPGAYPEAGEPWQALKLYYDIGSTRPSIDGAARGDARRRASSRRSASGSKRWQWEDKPRAPNAHDARAVRGLVPAPRRRAAGARHAGRPERLVLRGAARPAAQAWPTEDFELARVAGRLGPLPEDDLFAGVRETVTAVSRCCAASLPRRARRRSPARSGWS